MPYLREDEAPTQAEREKMPAHVFGLPDEKKYPLDSPEHVRAAASYGAKEHNAGRLSDDKFAELSKHIETAKKKFGIGEENQDEAGGMGAQAGDGTADSREDAAAPHVVVHHTSDGPKVTLHASKAEAMDHAKDIRSNGGNVGVFSVKDYQKTQDPKFNEAEHALAGPHTASDVYKAEKATKEAKAATTAASKSPSPETHAKAAEAHLAAAKAHEAAAKSSPGFKAEHDDLAKLHNEAAQVHSEAAGSGAFEEDKHPRDEQGRFNAKDAKDSHAEIVQRYDLVAGRTIGKSARRLDAAF